MANNHSHTRVSGSTVSGHPKRKWLILCLIVGIVAIVGIVVIRLSHASGLISGRIPASGNPYVSYSANTNGTYTLKKSTNGDTRTAPNLEAAKAIGQVMYDEMQFASNPPSTPTSTPKTPTTPTPTTPTTPSTPSPATPAPTTTPTTPTTPTTTPITSPEVTKVVKNITESIGSNNNPSTSSGSSTNSSTASPPTSMTATNIAGLELNEEEKAQLNTQIEAIPASELVTISAITPINPKINNSKVTLVSYLLNNKLVYSSSKSPFIYDFDTTRIPNGAYRLDVVGVGNDGKEISHQITKFNIQNQLSLLQKLHNIITYPWYIWFGQN